jgi:predicted ATPase
MEGIVQMQQGLADLRATGTELLHPYFLGMLVQAYEIAGQISEGLRVLDEALALVTQCRARYYEAELYRLKGELLLKLTDPDERNVETAFQQALDLARYQQAKAWELRAAMSLSRLWRQQGKRQDAYDLLAPVYHWFTEGFDTADLQEAKALLHSLA